MKFRTLFISLAILIIAVYSVYKFRIIPVFGEADFNIPDTSRVESFKISGKDTTELIRTRSGWVVNQGLKANPVAVDNFLYCFNALEIEGILTDISKLQDSCRRIEIRTPGGDLKLRFYFNERNAYLHHEGGRKIYRVGIKGNSEADLSDIFSDDPEHWQARVLVDIPPDDIAEITVIPSFPWKTGFSLIRKDSSILLASDDRVVHGQEEFNYEKAIMYFSYFRDIFYDEVVKNDSLADRLLKEDPFFTITVKTLDGQERKISIFQVYSSDGTKDIFNALVTINGSKQVFKVNFSVLDLLLGDFESFMLN